MSDHVEEVATCLKCNLSKPITKFEIKHSTQRRKTWCCTCCRKAARVAGASNRQQREMNATGTDYSSRNANLRRLGFSTYAEYLASDLWKSIRRKVYAIKGGLCFLCNRVATELHHNRYHANDLTGKRLKFISPVCHACHTSIEFSGEQKSTVTQAKNAFRKRRRAKNKASQAP